MNKFQAKKAGLERRKRRVRGKVTGTADRPRLAVHRTNAHIYAQVIDDVDGKTIFDSLVSLSTGFPSTGIQPLKVSPRLNFVSYGISTVCASATLFSLTLAPG